MRLPIILDTDPGIDDAAAIAAALFAPELDLQLMTTVAGNVSVEKTTRNALQLLHFWHADVPLAQGASMPLVRPLRDAASVHGESGMEGYDFVEHQRQPLAKPAFRAIRDALMHAAEPITLVAIGPLTNIALLLTQYPECVFNIRRLVIMGGSAGRGNFTPNAEFNIAIDPEAAAKVFHSGLEIVMCGLDVTNRALLTADYLATLPTLNQTGKMLHALFSHYRSGSMSSGLRMHDLCAIAWLARPELFTLQPCFVAVETQGTRPPAPRWWISKDDWVSRRTPSGAGYRRGRVSALGGGGDCSGAVIPTQSSRREAMTYGQAYLSGWKETFNFSGRASRQQFWTFFLINLLIASAPLAVWCLATRLDPRYGILSFVVIPFAALWLLLMAIPLLAVGCRRMHDIGRSGIWFVLGVIIPWFAVISLALCCLRSA